MNELVKSNTLTKQEAISIREMNGELAMSSLRIAEVTGKEHKHVLRDILVIFKEAEIGETKFSASYLTTQNKEAKHYLLPEFEFNLVISG